MHDVASGVAQRVYGYESSVGPAFIWSVSFSGSGDRLAVGCWNHKAYVYANPRVDESELEGEYDFDVDVEAAMELSSPLIVNRDRAGYVASAVTMPLRCRYSTATPPLQYRCAAVTVPSR